MIHKVVLLPVAYYVRMPIRITKIMARFSNNGRKARVGALRSSRRRRRASRRRRRGN
jgi:hypothetical protein